MKKSKQEHPDLQSFKSMALWLLAYKLFRDFIELLRAGYKVEPEKFFESWVDRCMPTTQVYSKEEQAAIWKLFLGLLFARVEQPK